MCQSVSVFLFLIQRQMTALATRRSPVFYHYIEKLADGRQFHYFIDKFYSSVKISNDVETHYFNADLESIKHLEAELHFIGFVGHYTPIRLEKNKLYTLEEVDSFTVTPPNAVYKFRTEFNYREKRSEHLLEGGRHKVLHNLLYKDERWELFDERSQLPLNINTFEHCVMFKFNSVEYYIRYDQNEEDLKEMSIDLARFFGIYLDLSKKIHIRDVPPFNGNNRLFYGFLNYKKAYTTVSEKYRASILYNVFKSVGILSCFPGYVMFSQ